LKKSIEFNPTSSVSAWDTACPLLFRRTGLFKCGFTFQQSLRCSYSNCIFSLGSFLIDVQMANTFIKGWSPSYGSPEMTLIARRGRHTAHATTTQKYRSQGEKGKVNGSGLYSFIAEHGLSVNKSFVCKRISISLIPTRRISASSIYFFFIPLTSSIGKHGDGRH
jgi:hypothetical protein